MVANVVGLSGITAVEDVGVTGGWARLGPRVGRRLGVAQCHAYPQRRVELEVECAAGAVSGGQNWRVLGQAELVARRVTRAGLVRIEQQRRFVVADVLTEHGWRI